MNILICFDAGNDIGYGHAKRSLYLASKCVEAGHNVSVLKSGQNNHQLDKNKYYTKIKQLKTLERYVASSMDSVCAAVDSLKINTIVLDISHKHTYQNISLLKQTLKKLKDSCDIHILDSARESALCNYLEEKLYNKVYIPYFGEIDKGGETSRVKTGTKYFLLDLPVQSIDYKLEDRDYILITCGGSDPYGISKFVLEAFNSIESVVKKIKLVIGPRFLPELICELKTMVDKMKHEVQIVSSPEDLLSLMQESLLAISTSGLTKYELAASGTPAMLISIDREHYDINQTFLQAGSAIDVGVMGTFSKKYFTEQLTALLADHGRRCEMSTAGKNIIDGLGAQRIISEIEEV